MPIKITYHYRAKQLLSLRLLLLSVGLMLFWQSTISSADESIWYRTDDPLNTEAQLPPPIPEGYSESTACNARSNEQALTLADVAEATLCNNPQTRNAYASARVQAAQLGIAKSAYLPTVNDSVAANLNVALPEQTFRNNPYSKP